MKKILVSLMTIAMVSALIGGGVYAYFSDTETSTGNTFTAGTMDLNLDGGNANVVKFTVANVKPGDTGSGSYTVANVGTIPGYLDLTPIAVTQSTGSSTDPELADEAGGVDTAQLGNYLMVHIFVDADHDGTWDAGEADIFGTSAAPAAVATIGTGLNSSVALADGGTVYIAVAWSVPASATNRIQGDGVTLDITFSLDQQA